jgi:hypothetical protein
MKNTESDLGLFDKKLDLWRGYIPGDVTDAAVYVVDTLELCWAGAMQVFEDKATPELALAIYDRLETKKRECSEREDQ